MFFSEFGHVQQQQQQQQHQGLKTTMRKNLNCTGLPVRELTLKTDFLSHLLIMA